MPLKKGSSKATIAYNIHEGREEPDARAERRHRAEYRRLQGEGEEVSEQQAATTTAVTFDRERLLPPLLTEMLPLLEAHYAEISSYPDIPLDPDWPAYADLDAAGVLRVFTARARMDYTNAWGTNVDPRGPQLIGYAVFLVRHHP